MTILDIMALCLQYGEKVHIVFSYKDENGKQKETDAYFGGIRYYEGPVIKDFQDFFPIFKEIDKNGNMSNRLLKGVTSWSPQSLQSISKLTNEELRPEAIPSLVELAYNLKQKSHDSILNLMKSFAHAHPGRPKIWLPYSDGVSGVLDAKYCSYSGTIIAVSLVGDELKYDINTGCDVDNDVPDYRDVCRCGIWVEDELYLLKVILDSIEDPVLQYPDEMTDQFSVEDGFFSYIKPGARLRYSEDYKQMRFPGPIVKVKNVHIEDDTIDGKTFVDIVSECNGKELSVEAYTLEPLAEGE